MTEVAVYFSTNILRVRKKKTNCLYCVFEPGDTPEKIADWYSDVKSFDLWLISPNQQKTKLIVTPGTDTYTAELTPEQNGVYTLAVGHATKELGGITNYQFNATAAVTVGLWKHPIT